MADSWSGVALNALVLASALSLANGEVRMGGEAASSGEQVIAGRNGVANMGTFFSLCSGFIVGISFSGFLWKGFHKVNRAVAPEPPSTPPPSPPDRKIARAISVGSLKQYRLKEIEDMTDNFKQQLGRGGQGIVYFAVLPDGRGKAAVKRLQKNLVLKNSLNDNNNNQEIIEKAFWAELKTISRLHHRNLVALLGYCVENDDLFLVYEFMANGSLSQQLHQKAENATVLDWKARMRCAVEVAQGLEYLHNHASPALVHRDIKAGNILFDAEMNAKIADFGLSKPVDADHEATVTTRVRGTHGYVDPSYVQNGIPCDKNDVYSYGVVLLELITGKRALEQKVSLVHWCRDILGTDERTMLEKLPRIVDARMTPLDVSYEQIFEVVELARSCVQEKQENRPSMQAVVAGLYNANCKDLSTSTEENFPSTEQVPLNRFVSSNGGSSSHDGSGHKTQTNSDSSSSSYDIKENSILLKCTVAGSKVVLRCKIWPTLRNFGLNKVEASLNGAFLWKKGLWFYNGNSTREFTVGDDVKLIAQWHVTLRTNWDALAPNDPRRNQGPFCVEYLAIKDANRVPLVEYHGDRSPLLDKSPSQERHNPRRQSSGGSGSGSGSHSVERRRSSHGGRPRRSSSPI